MVIKLKGIQKLMLKLTKCLNEKLESKAYENNFTATSQKFSRHRQHLIMEYKNVC